MTATELQTLRTALYTQYLAWINAGCPQAYSINGRSYTKVDGEFFLKQLNQLDAALSRTTSGGFYAAQVRNPE
jgi:hypothetical protein